MKRVIILIGFLFFVGTAAVADYSAFIEDLPLMENMVEQQDNVVSFDKPAGRIIQTQAITKSTEKEVLNFYNLSLPQLGWTKAKDHSFKRDNETLTITVNRSGNSNIVIFTIVPE